MMQKVNWLHRQSAEIQIQIKNKNTNRNSNGKTNTNTNTNSSGSSFKCGTAISMVSFRTWGMTMLSWSNLSIHYKIVGNLFWQIIQHSNWHTCCDSFCLVRSSRQSLNSCKCSGGAVSLSDGSGDVRFVAWQHVLTRGSMEARSEFFLEVCTNWSIAWQHGLTRASMEAWSEFFSWGHGSNFSPERAWMTWSLCTWIEWGVSDSFFLLLFLKGWWGAN